MQQDSRISDIGEWCQDHMGALIVIGLVLFFMFIVGGFINWRVSDAKAQPVQEGTVIKIITEDDSVKCVVSTTSGQKLVSPSGESYSCLYDEGDRVKIRQEYTGSRYGEIQ